MAAILAKARVNHGSIPVARDSSSAVVPFLNEESSAHSRSSWGCSGVRSAVQSAFSHSSDRLVISSDLTAFWKAASKERSMAITSPVAFICVPMVRSPAGNLSKGHRGILTTQ